MREHGLVLFCELAGLTVAVLALFVAIGIRVLEAAFGRSVADRLLLPSMRTLWRAGRQLEREEFAATARLDWQRQLIKARASRAKEKR